MEQKQFNVTNDCRKTAVLGVCPLGVAETLHFLLIKAEKRRIYFMACI